MKDSFVNASAWDLYDTYAQLGNVSRLFIKLMREINFYFPKKNCLGFSEGEKAMSMKEFQILMDTALKTKGVTIAQVKVAL